MCSSIHLLLAIRLFSISMIWKATIRFDLQIGWHAFRDPFLVHWWNVQQVCKIGIVKLQSFWNSLILFECTLRIQFKFFNKVQLCWKEFHWIFSLNNFLSNYKVEEFVMVGYVFVVLFGIFKEWIGHHFKQ